MTNIWVKKLLTMTILMAILCAMNHDLSSEILCTTRPLTKDDRVDLWKERMRALREIEHFPARPDHSTPLNDPSDAMVRARLSLPLL